MNFVVVKSVKKKFFVKKMVIHGIYQISDSRDW